MRYPCCIVPFGLRASQAGKDTGGEQSQLVALLRKFEIDSGIVANPLFAEGSVSDQDVTAYARVPYERHDFLSDLCGLVSLFELLLCCLVPSARCSRTQQARKALATPEVFGARTRPKEYRSSCPLGAECQNNTCFIEYRGQPCTHSRPWPLRVRRAVAVLPVISRTLVAGQLGLGHP